MLPETENLGKMPESDPCISLMERSATLFFNGERKVQKDLSVSCPSHGLSHHTSLCWREEWDHTQHLVSKGKTTVFSLAETAWMEL